MKWNPAIINFNSKAIFFACLIMIASCVQSCDPARIFIIKSSRRPNVSVTLYGNNKILPSTSKMENEKIVIRVPATDESIKKDTSFYYGFGVWQKGAFMTEFSKDIDSIIIANRDGKIVLDNLIEVTNYLSKNRRGLAKNILVIKAR